MEKDFTNGYKIYFSKQLNKKHKIFDEGILIYGKSKCVLLNSDGKELIKDYKPKNLFQKIEDLEVEIDCAFQIEDYFSGKIFMPNSINNLNIKIIKKPINNNKNIICEEINLKDPEIFFLTEKNCDNPCYIEKFLSIKMRAHQKEGVKFMFNCVTGLKEKNISGYPFSKDVPFIKKIVIVAPLTLVMNWEKEIIKWLGNMKLIPLVAIGKKEENIKQIDYFIKGGYRCLILSYENFRIHSDKISNVVDLLIFDEGHRLKNSNIKTYQIFSKVNCVRRIILSGTPLQNSLDDLYSCVNFVNPGFFQALPVFRKVFGEPILKGLKKNSTTTQRLLAEERSKELSSMVSKIVLRRNSDILDLILPPKNEFFIFIKMSNLQRMIYKSMVEYAKEKRDLFTDNFSEVLPFITIMRKLLNHPKLLYNDQNQNKFPDGYLENYCWEDSYKLTYDSSNDKIIIVSNYTQTLDLISEFCSFLNKKHLRLDGKTPAQKRQNVIDTFCQNTSEIKILLLCSKAGGTGLNLTAANRMILMENDWNPTNDSQVMARIWRDGQKKTVFIYRLVVCGTIEEKILQRQFLKEEISENIVDSNKKEFTFDEEFIKNLFIYSNNDVCNSFDAKDNQVNQMELLVDILFYYY